MIDKEDLRIGNFIIGKTVDGHKDKIDQVYELMQRGIATSPIRFEITSGGFESVAEPDTDRPLPYVWASGIPISTDWLAAFGFRVDVREYLKYEKDGLTIHFQPGKWIVTIFNTEVVGLEYVHELQNLHFDLTGKHLTAASLPPLTK